MNFQNWRIWIELLFVSLYKNIFVYIYILDISYRDAIYDVIKQKECRWKKVMNIWMFQYGPYFHIFI
jgi:hypothetical protein